MAEFVTPAELSRRIGVSKQAVAKAIKVGRVPVYDETGAPVGAEYAGRKLVKPDEAAKSFRLSRARIDDAALGEMAAAVERDLAFDLPPPSVQKPDADEADASSPSLLTAKTQREALQADLLRMRIARERGELVSLQAQLDALETAGRAAARAIQIMPTWAEEIAGVLHAGGVPALAAWLRGKANEICVAVADSLAAPADDVPPEDDAEPVD